MVYLFRLFMGNRPQSSKDVKTQRRERNALMIEDCNRKAEEASLNVSSLTCVEDLTYNGKL